MSYVASLPIQYVGTRFASWVREQRPHCGTWSLWEKDVGLKFAADLDVSTSNYQVYTDDLKNLTIFLLKDQ